MIDAMYNARILELAGNIPGIGRLAAPSGTSTKHSRLCGSVVTVDLRLLDGQVTEFAHEVKACALGQASASILARHAVGASVDEIRHARDALKAMLKDGGPPPEGRFADLGLLEPVRDYKARHASTLLAFEAACEAIDTAAPAAS